MAAFKPTFRAGTGSAIHNGRYFIKDNPETTEKLDFSKGDNCPEYTLKRNDKATSRTTIERNSEQALSGNDFKVVRLFGDTSTHGTLMEYEKECYKSMYSKKIEATNELYKRKGKKLLDVDRYYQAHKPTEYIIQIGNMGNNAGIEALEKCTTDLINTMKKDYPQAVPLYIAYHNDEQTPHAHLVMTFPYEKNGILEVNKSKCFEAMGLELPDPNKAEGRHNNRGTTFIKQVVNKFLTICRGYGLDMAEQERSNKKHKPTPEYIKEKVKELEEREQTLQARELSILRREREIYEKEEILELREANIEDKERAIDEERTKILKNARATGETIKSDLIEQGKQERYNLIADNARTLEESSQLLQKIQGFADTLEQSVDIIESLSPQQQETIQQQLNKAKQLKELTAQQPHEQHHQSRGRGR